MACSLFVRAASMADLGLGLRYRSGMRWFGLVLMVASACATAAPALTSAGAPSTVSTPSTTELTTDTMTAFLKPDVTDDPTVSTTATSHPPITTVSLTDEFGRPRWLGTVVLALTDAGFGEVQPTPPELVSRRFGTVDHLGVPTDAGFVASISPVPEGVVARSTWIDECPVALSDLVYVTVSHIGFDGQPHTGELIVNAQVAEHIVGVFEALFDAAYPIEEMRVVDAPELELAPTGDGNNTTAFVCRPATGSNSWSQHAYGLAIDINPFHNPYLKGDVVLPELASYYLDRSLDEPGMITGGGEVVAAFDAIGWFWGGDWTSMKDWMHFSLSGR